MSKLSKSFKSSYLSQFSKISYFSKSAHSSKLSQLTLILILLLALFFRFYRLLQLQYFSFDDEIFTLVINRIVRQQVFMLVSPNTTIAVSLGSFFHLFSALFFKLLNFESITILTLGSVWGVLTTYFMYLTGRELKNQEVGLIAAFIYATSFLISLSDRRWWPLTPDPFLILVAVYSLSKIVKGRLLYSLPLVIAGSIAWHADPSLAIIPLAFILAVVIFNIPLKHRHHLPALIALTASIAPLILFELRHPGSISHPIQILFARLFESKGETYAYATPYNPLTTLNDFTRAFFPRPSMNLEEYLSPFPQILSPALSPLSQIITLSLLLTPLYSVLVRPAKDKTAILIVYLFLIAFIVGTLFFNLIFKHNIHQHYYVVIWPVAVLLAAFTLEWLSRRHLILPASFLILFLGVNLAALQQSSFQYPAHNKDQIAGQIIASLSNQPFSLYIQGNDRDVDGIGGLFFARSRFPQNSSYYLPLDWVYRAYSLYPLAVAPDYTQPQVVIIYPYYHQPNFSGFAEYTPVNTLSVSHLKATILVRSVNENRLP